MAQGFDSGLFACLLAPTGLVGEATTVDGIDGFLPGLHAARGPPAGDHGADSCRGIPFWSPRR